MYKTVAVLVLATALAGCDAVDVLTDGFKHTRAVEADLLGSTGMKPQVGFSWKNGQLISVTVNFTKLYEDKPLRELAALTRTAVVREFKQTPKIILLSFTLDPGTTAQSTN